MNKKIQPLKDKIKPLKTEYTSKPSRNHCKEEHSRY